MSNVDVDPKGRRRAGRALPLDVWREAQRRWMVAGVLAAVALAVLAPRAGAVGGALHSEVSAAAPLFYVYYTAGRRARAGALWAGLRAHARLHAVCVAHAHVVAPALAAALLTALRDGVDYRIVKGVSCHGSWKGVSVSSHIEVSDVAMYCLDDEVSPSKGDAVVARRRLRLAVAVPELARGGAQRGAARVPGGAARRAARHRAHLRPRITAAAAERGVHAGDDGGALRGGAAARRRGGVRGGAAPARAAHARAGAAPVRAGAAVRGVLRAPVRLRRHPAHVRRTGHAGARGAVGGGAGGHECAVRALRRAGGRRRAPRHAVRAAPCHRHPLGIGGRLRVGGAGAAAGGVPGAGAGAAAGGTRARRLRRSGACAQRARLPRRSHLGTSGSCYV